MLPIAYNPYFDDILRRHLAAAAARVGLHLEDLEGAFRTEADAVQFLREQSEALYVEYEEAASAAVDYVGWIVTDADAPQPSPPRASRRT